MFHCQSQLINNLKTAPAMAQQKACTYFSNTHFSVLGGSNCQLCRTWTQKLCIFMLIAVLMLLEVRANIGRAARSCALKPSVHRALKAVTAAF